MPNGGERMMPQHSGPCIAHYRANLLTHSRFVAMDGALFAGWFLLAILAMLQTRMRIFEQCSALCAEPVWTMLMTMAIDGHHLPDGTLFSFYARHIIAVPYSSGKQVTCHARDDEPHTRSTFRDAGILSGTDNQLRDSCLGKRPVGPSDARKQV